jgi:hypothetical protein
VSGRSGLQQVRDWEFFFTDDQKPAAIFRRSLRIELRFGEVAGEVQELHGGSGGPAISRAASMTHGVAEGLETPWFDSSVIAAVEPAPVNRRVSYTFANVPLNAGRLITSQIVTALQEYQRRPQERGFDYGMQHREPLPSP